MLPLLFIALLLIAMIPGGMVEAAKQAGTLPEKMPAHPDMRVALFAAGSLLFWHVAISIVSIIQTRRALRVMHEPSVSATAVASRVDAFFFWCRVVTLIVTALHLFATPLPAAVFYWRDHTIGNVPLAAEMLFMLPAVLTWFVLWTGSYYIESAARERSMPFRLAQAMPVHEMPSLGAFLALQARHNLFPLLFVFVLTLIDQCAGDSQPAQIGKFAASLVVMLAGVPPLLTKLWSTTTLEGPLRVRLDHVAALHRLRFRNILMWRTHNLVLNAAILGWIPGARYFLMSDHLLETLTDRQLEAVFAHEVGHGVRRHIPWYLAAVAAAALFGSGLADLVDHFFPGLAAHHATIAPLVATGACVGLAVAAITLIAPYFEHEADWFACRHMARTLVQPIAARAALPAVAATAELPDVLTALPTDAERLTLDDYLAGNYPHSAMLAETAALARPPTTMPERVSAMDEGTEVFVSALDAIVHSANKERSRRGLMHPSINVRITLLRQLAKDEWAEAHFERVMWRVRAGIVALAIIGVGVTVMAAALQTKAAPAAVTTAGGTTLPSAGSHQ